MTTAQAIYNEALSLSDVDRAALVHDLISSLSNDSLKAVSQEEIARRVALIHSGQAESRTADDVFRDIRSKL